MMFSTSLHFALGASLLVVELEDAGAQAKSVTSTTAGMLLADEEVPVAS